MKEPSDKWHHDVRITKDTRTSDLFELTMTTSWFVKNTL